MKIDERLKKAKKLLEQLKEEWIFVEGKRDKSALEDLGFRKILTISGNLRLSCEKLQKKKGKKVFVLTDLDRRGDQLARMAKDELEGMSIIPDIQMRKKVAHILRIRYFEDAKRAYNELQEEGEKYG